MKTLKLKSNKPIPHTFTGIVEFWNGAKVWYKNGKWHRSDGPAVIFVDGSVDYWINGERVNKKAIELFNWLFPENEL